MGWVIINGHDRCCFCPSLHGGLININASVRNNWKSQGKVREFDKDWRVASLDKDVIKADHEEDDIDCTGVDLELEVLKLFE